MWELTVDIDHTFTFAVGNHDVLVHNMSCPVRDTFDDLSPIGEDGLPTGIIDGHHIDDVLENARLRMVDVGDLAEAFRKRADGEPPNGLPDGITTPEVWDTVVAMPLRHNFEHNQAMQVASFFVQSLGFETVDKEPVVLVKVLDEQTAIRIGSRSKVLTRSRPKDESEQSGFDVNFARRDINQNYNQWTGDFKSRRRG